MRFTQPTISQTLVQLSCMARKAGQTDNRLISKALQGDVETGKHKDAETQRQGNPTPH